MGYVPWEAETHLSKYAMQQAILEEVRDGVLSDSEDED
jgi:hypothetical protein